MVRAVSNRLTAEICRYIFRNRDFEREHHDDDDHHDDRDERAVIASIP